MTRHPCSKRPTSSPATCPASTSSPAATSRSREGEIVGIIGPNGAGQVDAAQGVFGLVPVRSGHGHACGARTSPSAAAHELVERGVGYVPQVANVFPSLTVDDNLRMGAYLRAAALRRRGSRAITELFPRLAERRRQRAGSLSGGERQMLAMAAR